MATFVHYCVFKLEVTGNTMLLHTSLARWTIHNDAVSKFDAHSLCHLRSS